MMNGLRPARPPGPDWAQVPGSTACLDAARCTDVAARRSAGRVPRWPASRPRSGRAGAPCTNLTFLSHPVCWPGRPAGRLAGEGTGSLVRSHRVRKHSADTGAGRGLGEASCDAEPAWLAPFKKAAQKIALHAASWEPPPLLQGVAYQTGTSSNEGKQMALLPRHEDSFPDFSQGITQLKISTICCFIQSRAERPRLLPVWIKVDACLESSRIRRAWSRRRPSATGHHHSGE